MGLRKTQWHEITTWRDGRAQISSPWATATPFTAKRYCYGTVFGVRTVFTTVGRDRPNKNRAIIRFSDG